LQDAAKDFVCARALSRMTCHESSWKDLAGGELEENLPNGTGTAKSGTGSRMRGVCSAITMAAQVKYDSRNALQLLRCFAKWCVGLCLPKARNCPYAYLSRRTSTILPASSARSIIWIARCASSSDSKTIVPAPRLRPSWSIKMSARIMFPQARNSSFRSCQV
jgi:hypothetical protein